MQRRHLGHVGIRCRAGEGVEKVCGCPSKDEHSAQGSRGVIKAADNRHECYTETSSTVSNHHHPPAADPVDEENVETYGAYLAYSENNSDHERVAIPSELEKVCRVVVENAQTDELLQSLLVSKAIAFTSLPLAKHR